MVFFMNADEKIYSRYGGRDASSPDHRQSLAGLHYAMESVLRLHGDGDSPFVPRLEGPPRLIREIAGSRGGRCMHCHQVQETIVADLRKNGKWDREMIWRYPLPENLGFDLEIDRGNVVRAVKPSSPAAVIGMKPGDVLEQIAGMPVHSFGDAQFALEHSPASGSVDVAWRREDQRMSDRLALQPGWRKTDITWRPSMHRMMPSARLYGDDLKAEEKKTLGLSAKQLAFRQKEFVPIQSKSAGIKAGDIILGFDDKPLEMNVDEFLKYVQINYLVDDHVTINVLRAKDRLRLPMTLSR